MTESAVKAGARGIIHAGSGNGSVHGNTEATLSSAVKQGVVVVHSNRVGSGFVTNYQPYRDMGLLKTNSLNPQKARILLQLALTKTSDPKVIQEMFNRY